MDKAPAITGVAEIVLNVDDLPVMINFYQQILGFNLFHQACHDLGAVATEGGIPTIAFLTISETETPLGRNGHPQVLVLIDHRNHFFAKQRYPTITAANWTLNHLAFEIPPATFEEHFQRLVRLELEPIESEFPAFSAKAMFFSDPEGNRLELICHQHFKTAR